MRIDYGTVAPEALNAMLKTNAYLEHSSVPELLRRHVELLISEINDCSYCKWLHTKQIRDLGDSEERIAGIKEWRRAECFTDEERVAFEWTEAVTRIIDGFPSDNAFDALHEHFEEIQIVELTVVIANMNAMNRLAISFRHEAPKTS